MNIATYYITPLGASTLSSNAANAAALSPFDRQRWDALKSAVETILVPEFQAEARAQLARCAADAITAEYAQQLRKRVLMAPVVPPQQPLRKRKADGGKDDDDLPAEVLAATKHQYPWTRPRFRVLAIGVARHGQAGGDCAAVLDPKGEVIATQHLPPEKGTREGKIAL
jgi:hypothetical protein